MKSVCVVVFLILALLPGDINHGRFYCINVHAESLRSSQTEKASDDSMDQGSSDNDDTYDNTVSTDADVSDDTGSIDADAGDINSSNDTSDNNSDDDANIDADSDSNSDSAAGASRDIGDNTVDVDEDVGDNTVDVDEDVGDTTVNAGKDIGDTTVNADEDISDDVEEGPSQPSHASEAKHIAKDEQAPPSPTPPSPTPPSLTFLLGVISGLAVDFSDEGTATCCPKIRYAYTAAGELTKACNALGGRFWKNERFDDTAYCYSRRIYGGGYKYKCFKLVAADCYK